MGGIVVELGETATVTEYIIKDYTNLRGINQLALVVKMVAYTFAVILFREPVYILCSPIIFLHDAF